MWHLAGGVVLVQDGYDLTQDGAELRGGDGAVFLELRHEAHQSRSRIRMVSALALELGTQQSQGYFTRTKPDN